MLKYLERRGWFHYYTSCGGCSNTGGTPTRLLNHIDYPGFIISLKGNKFQIRRDGRVEYKGEGKEDLESKLKEYGFKE